MTYPDPFNPMPSSFEEDERRRGMEPRGGQSYWAVGVLAVIAGAFIAIVALA